MKNLKLITLALAISISSISFATPENNEDPKSELREQIVKILGKTVKQIDRNKIEAEVVFTINNKKEIVIISVNSTNKEVQYYVKGKLNYKKVNVKIINEGKIYRMPLTIVNE